MSPLIGWTLAAIGLVVGYSSYGWPGVALAVTVIVFWLLLQFSRAMRVMRRTAEAPLGAVESAVMVHTRLRSGMRMLDVLRITGSLGRQVDPADDTRFRWVDAGNCSVEARFVGGRLSQWELQRPQAIAD